MAPRSVFQEGAGPTFGRRDRGAARLAAAADSLPSMMQFAPQRAPTRRGRLRHCVELEPDARQAVAAVAAPAVGHRARGSASPMPVPGARRRARARDRRTVHVQRPVASTTRAQLDAVRRVPRSPCSMLLVTSSETMSLTSPVRAGAERQRLDGAPREDDARGVGRGRRLSGAPRGRVAGRHACNDGRATRPGGRACSTRCAAREPPRPDPDDATTRCWRSSTRSGRSSARPTGATGWPHLMPLWYVVRDGRLWSWTYAKSQKVRNLERDPRATLQVEAGVEYEVLRGVMLERDVTIHRETDDVAAARHGDLRALHAAARSTTRRARWSPRRRPSASRSSSSSARA